MIHRRELIQIAAASALPAAPRHFGEGPLKFFTPAEDAVLDRLADIILPTDEQSPGAHEAKVSRYIDLVAAYSTAALQQRWREGIKDVEAAARSRFGAAYSTLTRQQQEELMGVMAAHEGKPENALERFFEMLKPAVVDGYRFSEIGTRQYMRWKGNGGALSYRI
ncbi:MAG: gluconate 2-dehydrogenase subunit 3 family protein [Acidobacteria bacterium]|nr:gluconate 2-dehydrogenase subunit 3 family protein [Acidobacteriota bacterium]